MPGKGTIHGTHHLTFCVGGAQEDYDFHVRLLGLKSVKKTVLFDGEIPIYHLYYANGAGDASTILTAFPYRQAGWMGRRGTNQLKALLLSVPANAIGFWADRLSAAGVENEEAELFGTHRLNFAHPTGIPYSLVGVDGDDRTPYEGAGVSAEHAIRGAYGTTTSVREPEPMDYFLTQGMAARKLGSDGGNHQYEVGNDDGHGRILELVEEPDLPQGTWHFGEGTIHHTRSTRARPKARPSSRTGSSGWASPTSPTSRIAATSSPSTAARRVVRCSSSPTRRRRASRSTRRRTSSGRTCASRRTGRTAAARSPSSSRSTPTRRSRACRAPEFSSAPYRRGRQPSVANRGARSMKIR